MTVYAEYSTDSRLVSELSGVEDVMINILANCDADSSDCEHGQLAGRC